MDKFSKVLVSVAAASVLASGAMASGLVFGKYSQNGTHLGDKDNWGDDSNTTLWVDGALQRSTIKDAGTDFFGPIKVDELLKNQTDLTINAVDTMGVGGSGTDAWPGAGIKYNRMLAYYSDVDLGKDSTIKFKINCGMLGKTTSDVKLYAFDADTRRFVPVGYLTDYTTATKGALTGYTMVRFRLDSGTAEHNFTRYDGTLTQNSDNNVSDSDGRIPSGTVLVFGSETNVSGQVDGNITRLDIIPIKGDACGCVCDTTIEMLEAKDNNGQSLQAPLVNGAVPLVTYTPGLSAKVYHRKDKKYIAGYADSYIDTADGVDRKKFVDENDTANDTGELTSIFSIDVTNEAEYGIALGANDKYTLNVNRAIYCAVKQVDINGDKFTKNPTTGAYEYTGDFTNAIFIVDKVQNTSDNNITISVDGTNVICPGMWRVSLEIDPDENGVDNVTLLNVANAADWRINAMQFIIPYLNTDPNYGTYIVITNMGDKSASVFFDAYGDSGKNEGQATSAYYTNVQLGDIPKRSTRIYFPKDMNNAIKAKFPAWNANRYLAKFYVVADENNIEAAAFQKDGNNGKRSIPVLTAAYMPLNEYNTTGDKVGTFDYTGHMFHE